MLKASSGENLILGLSEENIRRLTEGYPIKVELREFGFGNGHVFLFYGKTEATMKQALIDAGLEIPGEVQGPTDGH